MRFEILLKTKSESSRKEVGIYMGENFMVGELRWMMLTTPGENRLSFNGPSPYYPQDRSLLKVFPVIK